MNRVFVTGHLRSLGMPCGTSAKKPREMSVARSKNVNEPRPPINEKAVLNVEELTVIIHSYQHGTRSNEKLTHVQTPIPRKKYPWPFVRQQTGPQNQHNPQNLRHRRSPLLIRLPQSSLPLVHIRKRHPTRRRRVETNTPKTATIASTTSLRRGQSRAMSQETETRTVHLTTSPRLKKRAANTASRRAE